MGRNIILLSVICQLSSAVVFAQFPYAVGARAMGMGSAYTAMAEDASAVYWNPAGLGYMPQKEVTGMYNKEVAGTRNLFFGYGQPLPELGGIGFGWYRVSNEFEKTDISGNSLGNSEYSGDVVTLGAGYYRGLPVSLGFNIKYLNEKIDTFSLNGFSSDIGMVYEEAPFRMALVLGNVLNTGMNGTATSGGSVKEEMPLKTVAGVVIFGSKSYEIKQEENISAQENGSEGREPDNIDLSYNFGCDIEQNRYRGKTTIDINPGAELWLNEMIGMRAGMKKLKYITAGLSLKYGKVRLDYAFVADQELENKNIFSTSIYF